MTEQSLENDALNGHASAECDEDGCYCPDDVFWGRLLGDDDPCAPGKDWVAAAFGVVASTMEPCAEFGEHPRGGHAEAVREAAEWGKCWECGSSRKGCNDKDACCAECQTTAGLTHVLLAKRETTADEA